MVWTVRSDVQRRVQRSWLSTYALEGVSFKFSNLDDLTERTSVDGEYELRITTEIT